MANFHVIRTARLTDRQLLDLVYALHAEVEVSSGTIRLGDGMVVDFLACERDQEPISDLDGDRHAILSARLSAFSDVRIEFLRGTCEDTQNPHANRRASPYFDEVFLWHDARQGRATAQQWIACIDAIENALPRTYHLHESMQGSDAIDVLRAEIAELAGQYRQMLAGLADERSAFRGEAEDERREAKAEYTEAHLRLETTTKERRMEFDEHKKKEQDRLQQRKDELDRREQDLDNRQHMQVRRELRERIS